MQTTSRVRHSHVSGSVTCQRSHVSGTVSGTRVNEPWRTDLLTAPPDLTPSHQRRQQRCRRAQALRSAVLRLPLPQAPPPLMALSLGPATCLCPSAVVGNTHLANGSTYLHDAQ